MIQIWKAYSSGYSRGCRREKDLNNSLMKTDVLSPGKGKETSEVKETRRRSTKNSAQERAVSQGGKCSTRRKYSKKEEVIQSQMLLNK